VVDESIIAAATTSSPNTSPRRPNGLLLVTIRLALSYPGRDQLEEQVGGLGLERDVADFIDDQDGIAAQAGELGLQPSGVVGLGEPGYPLGGGGERDPVPGLAGPDRQAGGQVRLACPRPGPRNTALSLAVTKSRVPRWAMTSRFRPRAWS